MFFILLIPSSIGTTVHIVTNPEHILYVDDEEALLDIGRIFLERAGGITVDVTTSPIEALRMILSCRYDAVVSDYQMPEMDGLALLKRVREAGSRVPFIIFTGKGREEVAIEALNRGADFYIQKGGNPKAQFAELANAVRQLAGRRRAEAAVHKTEEMLYKAQSLAHLGSWEFDHRTGRLAWSDEAYHIFGLDVGEPPTYERFLSMVHPDDRSLVDTAYFSSIADGKDGYEIEHRILRSDSGEVRHVLERCDHLRGEFGEVVRSVGMVHDITERKLAELELLSRHEELQGAYEQLAAVEEELRSSFDDLAENQQRLSESERRLADIIDFLPDATFVIDTSGRVIAWNRAIEEMLGVPKAGMLGRGDYAYAVPLYGEARPVLIDYVLRSDGELSGPYHAMMKKGEILEGETYLPHPDGQAAVIMIRASPLYDREGRRVGAIEVIRDITRQKQVDAELLQRHEELQGAYEQLAAIEEELRSSFDDLAESQHRLQASEERYRRISESISDVAYSCVPENPGDYTLDWIAGAVHETTGYTDDEILAMRCWKAIVHPDDMPVFERAIFRLSPGMSSLFELRIVRKDGPVRWLRVSADCTDSEGRGSRLYGGWQDITYQKEAEEALRKSAEKMESIFRAAPTGIGMVMSGVLTEVNERFCDIAGYARDELIDRPARLLFPGEAEYWSALREMNAQIEKAGTCTLEIRCMRRDGAIVDVLLSGTPLDPADPSWGLTFTVQDISERKAMEKEIEYHARELAQQTNSLAVVNRKLNLMSSITRHDVLNQLTILLGNLSFAGEAVQEPEVSKYLARVQTAADRIRRQIEFTRDYTDLGVKSPEWRRVTDAIRSAAPHGLPVENEAGDLAVYADPMLSTVFSNLMDNTVRHGEAATRVRVRYRLEETGDLTLVWEDDGVGIPAGEKGRIFNRGVGKNTGLGLFLIREILGITGITITETGEPGKGARFEMRVPREAYRITE
ncbi:hybrid sensor histidine kinase/response regulator [Methanoculleus sp.]|uniref:hybrid sensor histidine kinase/response regulator n=1 Tax=Methanoculleus sp. TaxID=90427 RepID=UPI002FC74719